MVFEELLNIASPVETVNVDNNPFFVTSMSGRNRDYLEVMGEKQKTSKEMRQFVVACCLCDENGTRKDPDGVHSKQLGKMPNIHLDTLFKAAAKVSGLPITGDDSEELEGN